MGTRLVTIATFDLAAQARLAQNALRAAGVDATVTDEAVVTMEWLLSAAVGGIKVQVRDDDAERAVAELERAFGANGEGLARAAGESLVADDAARAEDDSPAEEAFTGPADGTAVEPDEPTPEPTEREQYARRAFYASLFGIVMPVLLFYSTYLVLVTLFSEGPLDTRGRWRAWGAFGLTAGGLAGWWGWTHYYPADFLFVM